MPIAVCPSSLSQNGGHRGGALELPGTPHSELQGRRGAPPARNSNSHPPLRRQSIENGAGCAEGHAGSGSSERSEAQCVPGIVGGRRRGLRFPWCRAAASLTAGAGAAGGPGWERVPHRGGGAAPAAMDSRVSELFGGCCRPTGAAFRGRGGAAPGGGGGGGSKAKKKSGRSRGGKANNPPYLPPEVSRLSAAAEGTPWGLSGPAKGPGEMGGGGGFVRGGAGAGMRVRSGQRRRGLHQLPGSRAPLGTSW